MASKINGKRTTNQKTDQELAMRRLRTELGTKDSVIADLQRKLNITREDAAKEYQARLDAMQAALAKLSAHTYDTIASNIADAIATVNGYGDAARLLAAELEGAHEERDEAYARAAAAGASADAVTTDENGFAARAVKAEAALIEAYDDLKTLLRSIRVDGYPPMELRRFYRQMMKAAAIGGEQERRMRKLWRETLNWMAKAEKRGYPELEGVGDTEDDTPDELRDDDCDVMVDEAFTPGARLASIFQSVVGKKSTDTETN